MKSEDIKKSFDNVEPSEEAKQRMLNEVLNHANKGKVSFMKSLNLKKAIPVVIMAFVLAGGLMIYNLTLIRGINNLPQGDRANDSDLIIGEMAQIKDQFKIENKTYNILYDSVRKEFNFPNTISTNDIGDKITTITTSVDDYLKGKEVYKYLPAGGEAVVAVKIDSEYKLFKFFNFDSYVNNQDEDAKTYLELYGIYKGEDISKIQIIGHSEESKIQGKLDLINEITDREKINEFYNYYSVIKNSSDNYFNKLFNYKGSNYQSQKPTNEPIKEPVELPPDHPEGIVVDIGPNSSNDSDTTTQIVNPNTAIDNGETNTASNNSETKDEVKTQAGSIPGSEGSVGNALGNSVTIRIYNQKGVYLDGEYYPNIAFISRHEVNEDFGKFLKEYIR